MNREIIMSGKLFNDTCLKHCFLSIHEWLRLSIFCRLSLPKNKTFSHHPLIIDAPVGPSLYWSGEMFSNIHHEERNKYM